MNKLKLNKLKQRNDKQGRFEMMTHKSKVNKSLSLMFPWYVI